ncbi:unnamed protein product, partial [Closterium sp. NIES-53]
LEVLELLLVLEALELEVLEVLALLVLEVLVLEVLELPEQVVLEALELETIALEALDLEALELEAQELEVQDELELLVLKVLVLEVLELPELVVFEALELETLELEALLEALELEGLEPEALEPKTLDLEVLAVGALELAVLVLEAMCSGDHSLIEHCEPASRPASPVRSGRRVPRSRPPPVHGTHMMALRPSSVPLRVPLPSPPASSLADGADPESDLVRAAGPTVTRLLAIVVTDPSFESTAASALVTELVDFAATSRLDYATSLVAESASDCPPSIGGECALGTDVLEDRQEDFEFLAAPALHLVALLLAPEGDPDAPDPTPHSFVEAITGPYSSQWQTAMDAEMASWKSTGTYVDAVPPPGVNIVDGMWILRVKRPPGSPPVFKAHYGSLHEEIWLRRPPGFTGSFSTGTQWSLRWPVYGLRQAPREWHDTLRTMLADLGFAPSTTDSSLFLRTDTSLPSFFILVYVNDLVFATAHTEGLALVKSGLQKRHTCTDLDPSALRLPVLLAAVHSTYWSLTLSSTFGRVRRAEWHVS